MIKTLIEETIEKLNSWTKAYDEGKPVVSDKIWDDLYFNLVEMERESGIYLPNSPTQKIIYQTVSPLKKIKHNHYLLSLDKTKDWNEFLNYFTAINPSKDVVGMLKLDGLTCSLRYIDGKLVSAETRGDGEIGEDILHNAFVIPSIPNRIPYREELIIDGEVICTYKDFKAFENDYANPRNFASGSARLMDSKECSTRNLTFVAWYVEKGLEDSLLKNFNSLKKFGFTVTPHTSSFDGDAKDFLEKQAEELGYPIDGLVGRFESREFGKLLGATGHHSRAAFAFKFYDEEYDTTLLDIVYEPSRNGQLTPVAILEPIEIDGSVVSRCTLHNISIMEELNDGNAHKGDILTIYKANAIIPECANWNHTGDEYISIPEICPVCGGNTEIHISDSGVKTLWCANEQCGGRLINRLDHMFGKKGFDIKGLSKATFEKLINWNFIEKPQDVFELINYKNDWISKPGFGEKSVNNILNAIENQKHTSLEKIICAAGIPLIGERVSKILAKEFKTWENFRTWINDGFDFSTLEGFGLEMHNAIVNFNYSEIDYIVENYLTIEEAQEDRININNSLQDKVIVITGKLVNFKNRGLLKEEIEKCGGRVTDSITSKTSMLINNDKESQSAKNKAAMKAGVPIVSEEEFINQYLKN